MFYLLFFTVPKSILVLLPVFVVAFVLKRKINPYDLFLHDPYPRSTCSMEDIIHDLESRQVKWHCPDLPHTDEHRNKE